ncbi:hypothetical protein [Rhizobium leguminosarum]|uniref:hypothetical protein n=1 Tax=Rhizobium leguminosarum TaxID=384 RepID=UPI0010E590C1|nr:hypothetical protein [Rhizobium leguminosarum]TBY71889.1 hypothetical protein E0H32_34075 [Rhizobium leguminosarum bv. viciae]
MPAAKLIRQWTPAWSQLRAIGNSRTAQLSALFPFIGYLIIFSDLFSDYLTPSAHDGTPLFDPLWSLRLLYIGLVFIGVASIIYAIRCPEVVKSYSSANQYFKEQRDFYTTPGNLLAAIERCKYRGAYHEVFRDLATRDATIGSQEMHTLADLLSWDFEHFNFGRWGSRSTASLSYAIGFLLISIPSITTFCRVLVAILEAN